MYSAKTTKYLSALSVAVLTFLVFSPALGNGFVNWDDDLYLLDNFHIRSLDARFLKWAFFDFYASNWHPLTWISHAVDCAVWGLNPMGHHLSNVLIHSVNSFLVVLLVVRLLQLSQKVIADSNKEGSLFFGVLLPALVTGLLFGVHPLHVESVAWVSERKDLLCAFFFLLSIFTYAGYVDPASHRPAESSSFFGRRKSRYLVSLGIFSLALLSKPMAVSLPAVLLILDWYPLGRLKKGEIKGVLLEKMPFFLLAATSSLVTIQAQEAGKAVMPLMVIPLEERIIVTFYAVFSYIGKFFIPINLLPFYQYPKNVNLFSLKFLVPAAFVLGISLLCIFPLKRKKIFSAVWCYFLITLFPVLGILQVGDQAMADRYTYLPSIGPFLLAGIGSAAVVRYLIGRIKKKAVAIVASAIFILIPVAALSELSFRQMKIWKDGETLWSRVIEVDPASGRGLEKLGAALQQEGRISEAIRVYELALSIQPWRTPVLNQLSICLIDTKQYDEALPFALRAAAAGAAGGKAFNTLGEIYFAKNEYQTALDYFRKALSVDATIPVQHFNVALTLEKMGEPIEACAHWAEYLRLGKDPPDADEVYSHMKELKCR
jgi:hypothetical protein